MSLTEASFLESEWSEFSAFTDMLNTKYLDMKANLTALQLLTSLT